MFNWELVPTCINLIVASLQYNLTSMLDLRLTHVLSFVSPLDTIQSYNSRVGQAERLMAHFQIYNSKAQGPF